MAIVVSCVIWQLTTNTETLHETKAAPTRSPPSELACVYALFSTTKWYKSLSGVLLALLATALALCVPARPQLARAVALAAVVLRYASTTLPFTSNCFVLNLAVWLAGSDTGSTRQMAGLAYLAAGFHKLNDGFMDSHHGCMVSFGRRFGHLLSLGLVGTTELDVVVQPAAALLGPPFILLELICGVALLSPSRSLQRISAVAIFLFAHAPLSLINFYEFSSAALSALLPDLVRTEDASRRSYLLINLRATLVLAPAVYVCGIGKVLPSWLQRFNDTLGFNPIQDSLQAGRGAIFVFSVCRLWRESEARLHSSRRSIGGCVALLGLLLLGTGPHIGLNTANGLTMFSSLRFWPDGRTNHKLRLMPAFARPVVTLVNSSTPLKHKGAVLQTGDRLHPAFLCNLAWRHGARVFTEERGEMQIDHTDPWLGWCTVFEHRVFQVAEPDGGTSRECVW